MATSPACEGNFLIREELHVDDDPDSARVTVTVTSYVHIGQTVTVACGGS